MTEVQAVFNSISNNDISNSPALRKTDELNELSCYSYDSCSENDSDFVKKSRGIVYDGDNIVFRSFGYTPEYTVNDLDQIHNSLENMNNSFRVFDSHEGTIIRVFYYKKWYVSTHRKLDAFKSKWSSNKSFGEEFEESLLQHLETPGIDGLTQYLESKYGVENGKGYVFLLRNNKDNRIVCNSPETPTVYYVGTFYENGSKFKLDKDFFIPTPKEHTNLKTSAEIVDYVNSVNYADKQGVIIFNDESQIKIYNSEYHEWYNVRGNEASLKFRYLQVRTNPILSSKLKILYPSYCKYFDEVETNIEHVSRRIHDAYINRFVCKRYTVVEPDEFRVVKECHGWHISNRTSNIVTLNKVQSVVNGMPPSVLNRMIKKTKLN
jgi:hypothetical protein